MKNKFLVQSTALAIVATPSLNSFADIDNNTIVVTANQMEQNINDTLTDIEVIERIDIEKIQAKSFTELLVNVAGVDTVQRGGHGQDSSVFARGSNSNQLLILVDGVRIGSATIGGTSVASISISQIERIEIVKGPRAALWGSDAIGGVIQIFTRRYVAGEHRVALSLGSNASREIDASVGFGSQEFSNTLTYNHKKTDGFDARIDDQFDNDGYEHDSLALRGDYKLNANNSLDWVAQIDESESEFDSLYGGGDIKSQNNYLWNIRYSQVAGNWKNQLSINSNRDQNLIFGNGVDKATAVIFETRRSQFSYLVRNNVSDNLSLGGGIDWLEDNIEKSTTVYTESKRTTKSAHLNANYSNDSVIAEFAVRYDDVESIANETTFNLGLGYRFNKNNQLSFNVGEGFKAPTFNDLYYPYGGNPDLQFETSNNKEIVYKGFYDIGNLIFTVYDSEVENLIQWVPVGGGIWEPQNVGKANISGIDASFNIRYGDYSHKITASYTDTEDGTNGSQLQLRAKKHFGYELTYSASTFDLFTQVQYVGERPDVDFQTYMPTMHDSYTQVNLGTSYTFNNQWQVKLKISDAFDESPTVVSGYRSGGTEFYLTLVYTNI
ncbi:MAG: TonB-dependent receptor [Gammaproteobacteria bacterium]|nr:TonB-dependent receptor [Gammaproteobacteria bacterium]